jgi:ribose transport system substrate-binding protein
MNQFKKKEDSSMKKMLYAAVMTLCGVFVSVNVGAQGSEWARGTLWDPHPTKMVDTSKFKKNPPYTIGFSNSDLSNAWTVFMQRQAQAEAEKHPNLIKRIFVTDAQGKSDKQINDIEDLYTKGMDILLTRANTEAALDPVITRLYKQGLPVITISKGIKSDNYTCFVASSNVTMGRMQVVWLAQMLKGKGNIVVLAGWAGAGSTEERRIGGYEALSQYPGIKVLDRQHTQYSYSKGKEIMQAMIQSFGKQIEGVWCDSGIQAAGAIEALQAAGIKVPITGDPTNSFLKRVQQWGYPGFAPGYPVTMGGDAVKLALKILQGVPVPHTFNAERLLFATHNTADVKTDRPWKDAAQMDKPDDWFPDHTLSEKWLPK